MSQMIEVKFPYDPDYVTAIKKVPGRTFDSVRKLWRVPFVNADDLMRILKKNRFPQSTIDSVQKQIEVLEKATAETIAKSAAVDTNVELNIPGFALELRPFQRAGVAYMLEKKRVLIGDEMGLGKTIQALATTQAANAYPAIVLCPAVAKLNWRNEISRCIPGKRVKVLEGTKDRVPAVGDVDFVVLNYDIAVHYVDALKALSAKTVIMDESHYLKSGSSQRTKATREIAKGAEYRICMSGTAMMNRPIELVPQLNILDRLKADFGGYDAFAHTYCNPRRVKWGNGWDFSGASNVDKLNLHLRSTCYIRRAKTEVLKELPEKIRSMIPVALRGEGLKAYIKARDNLSEFVAERAASNEEFLKSIAHLDKKQQAWAIHKRANEAIAAADRAETLVRLGALKEAVGTAKVEAGVDWIREFLESSDDKLIVFAVHKQVQQALKQAFPDAVTVFAENSTQERDAAVQRFQNDPQCRLFIGSLKAASVAITLTAASHVLFVELDWRPADFDQAEARAWRMGQQNSVNAYYLIAEKTIDGYLWTVLNEKRELTDKAIGDIIAAEFAHETSGNETGADAVAVHEPREVATA